MPSPSDPTYDQRSVRQVLEHAIPELGALRVRHLARGWEMWRKFLADQHSAQRQHFIAGRDLPARARALMRMATKPA